MKRKRSKSRSPQDDQEARIRRLRAQLQLPQDPHAASAPDRNPDSEEALLRYLVTIESEPTTTCARQLIADGIELPPPDSLRPEEVHDKLWEVIHGLARRRSFLQSTNHLNDLELYRSLWEGTLNDPSHDLDDSMGNCACYIDLLGDGSEKSDRLHLQYYADEFERQSRRQDYPDHDLPEQLDPPSDRDRHLPRQ